MDIKKGIQNFYKILKTNFLKFWKSEDTKVSIVRDILVALFIVFIILMILWAYTGQWFGTPMVAIESNSMQHTDEPFGRLGTINAGDMVLLVKVDEKEDIVTRGSNLVGAYAEKSGNFNYGDYGDVIVYKPYGRDNDDQIIHRAMCWVEYDEETDTYSVPEYKLKNVSTITIQELGLFKWTPVYYPHCDKPHSGFITKGDNPETNPTCDQVGGICNDTIKVEWISGKASCELPWIGTLNLIYNDIKDGENTVSNVPSDSIICLVITIGILISIPIALDIYSYFKEKEEEKGKNKNKKNKP
jgi:signal peptidase